MTKTEHTILVKKLRVWLQPDGISYFRHLLGLTGNVTPILKLNEAKKGLPVYNIHLWEGMKIRNFLRRQPECKTWNDHDFDNNYQNLLIEAITHNNE